MPIKIKKAINISKKMLTIFFVSCYLFFGFLSSINAAEAPWAVQEWRLFIDEPTVLKGYTIVAGENEFKLGVRDKAVSQAFTGVIRKLNDVWAPQGPIVDENGRKMDLKRVSPAWEFDLLGKPRIGVLNKPLFVAIKNSEKTMTRKAMFFWDGCSKKWKPLPGTNDIENNLTRAIIHLPYAILAVFEIPNEYEAWASWYSDSLTPSSPYNCASNNYKIGSYLKVCRLDNLRKCVKVKVVSTGPFVDNRIVDLTRTAFKAIGNPGGGILAVRVIPYLTSK